MYVLSTDIRCNISFLCKTFTWCLLQSQNHGSMGPSTPVIYTGNYFGITTLQFCIITSYQIVTKTLRVCCLTDPKHSSICSQLCQVRFFPIFYFALHHHPCLFWQSTWVTLYTAHSSIKLFRLTLALGAVYFICFWILCFLMFGGV